MKRNKLIGILLCGLLVATGAFAEKATTADNTTQSRFVKHSIGNKADTAVQATGTTASILAYCKGILDVLSGTTGVSTYPAASAAANGVSTAEVLRYVSEKQSNRVVEKAAVLSATSDNLFTVTGVILVRIHGSVPTAITRAGGAVTLELGTSDDTDLIMATMTDCRSVIGDVFGSTDAAAELSAVNPWLVVGASTIIQTTSVAADAGAITWYAEWKPLSSTGALVAAE